MAPLRRYMGENRLESKIMSPGHNEFANQQETEILVRKLRDNG